MPTTFSTTGLTRQTIEAARARYERGETVVSIAAALEIGESTIWRYRKDENWARPGARAPKASVTIDPVGKAAKKTPLLKKTDRDGLTQKTARLPRPDREENDCAADDAFDSERQSALVDRIWRVVEKQVAEIERRIGANETGAGEREARALAVMTRMLRELATLEGSAQRSDERASTAEDDEDEFDREVDEYCAKVTRILESMRERRDEAAPAGPGNAAADDRADGDELAVSGQGGSVPA